MFKKLIELIKQAIRKMVQIQNLGDTIKDKDIYTLSEEMMQSMDLWESMYKDESPWLSDTNGIYSLGIAPMICSNIATNVMNEFKSTIIEPGQDVKEVDESDDKEVNTRAQYLNEVYHRNLLATLNNNLEHALAVGGMIIKPYISNNTVYYNYCLQGEFVPLSFTDDGTIDDVAFYDDFVEGDKRYRRVERHIFDSFENTVTIINTAYVAQISEIKDKGVELGTPIPLSSIPKWRDISDEPVIIQDVEKPLFGYYKVAKANNIDSSSPLGISIFSRASQMIKRADIQFSRLDWEYEGGQMAVDVDVNATRLDDSGNSVVDQTRRRLYRKIDVGSDETYNVFAPGLRDDQYIHGLNTYLMRIEDLCEISRGTISEVQSEARTATELKILQQRSYNTIARNQKSLEKCLDDVIYATNVLVELYGLAPNGEYITTHEWSDSVLSDTDAELAQKMILVNAGILGKAEVRAWYCGEDEETAQSKIDELNKDSEDDLMNDLFGSGTNRTQKREDDKTEEKNPKDNQEE